MPADDPTPPDALARLAQALAACVARSAYGAVHIRRAPREVPPLIGPGPGYRVEVRLPGNRAVQCHGQTLTAALEAAADRLLEGR